MQNGIRMIVVKIFKDIKSQLDGLKEYYHQKLPQQKCTGVYLQWPKEWIEGLAVAAVKRYTYNKTTPCPDVAPSSTCKERLQCTQPSTHYHILLETIHKICINFNSKGKHINHHISQTGHTYKAPQGWLLFILF